MHVIEYKACCSQFLSIWKNGISIEMEEKCMSMGYISCIGQE